MMHVRNLLVGTSLAAVMAAVAIPSPALCSETITYTYDAKGRLVKVERSGSVNNGVQTTYSHDKADNRKNVKTTGAPSP